jgi:DNA invertase Pin-like site-specific DNA recombinase
MIRTALYIRVSTEDQAVHGISLEAQDAILTDYAKKNDLTIVDRYVDEGITARKAIAKRKELMRLLEDVKAGKIDQIIFTKLDRWTRNIRDFYKVQDVLDTHKVTWKTVLESYGTTDATSRLHLNIMLSISQDEADRTSERIKVVFENKVKNREYLNNKTPFGYRVEDSKVYKDEETQHIVEDIFRKFFECHSIRGTITYIADTYGIVFDTKNFRNLLSNTLYCGEYRGMTDFCEPYLTREQFDEMQSILATRRVKRTPTGIDYVFTSLLICGECGNRLGSCYNARGEGRSQRITCYRCSRHSKNNSCGFNSVIMEKTIEEYLWQNAVAELDKYKEQYEYRVSEQKKQKKAGTTEKAVERIKKKLNKLKDLYVNDLISIEDYKKDYDALNQQLADLAAESHEEENMVDIEAIKKLLSESTEEIYQTLTAADRRQFWRGFIDRIIVHSRDNMEIIWK